MEKKTNTNLLEGLDSLDDLNKIIYLLPGNIYWKDIHGAHQGCNLNLAKMYKLNSPEEIKGKRNQDLFAKEIADEINKIDKKVIQEDREITLEEVGVNIYKEKTIYLTTKTPLHDKKGKVIGLLGVSFDITDRKRAEKELEEAKEKAEAADKAKTEFLDNMRHDLRTPTSGIVGFSHIIKQEAKDPKIKEYSDNLIASGNALLEFLDEILDAISISTGEIPLMRKKFDLKEVMLKIIDLNQARAEEKKLKFSLSYDDRIPKYLLGDPKRVQRIFLELIANALNFTHQGYVKATVSLNQSNGREKVIKLEVQDTGIGIPEAKQEEIFLRFKRLTPSYQGIYRGAGLGLAIVKQFMDELHGEIKLKSGKEGSIFTCFIPLEEPLSSEHEEPATSPQEITTHQFLKPKKKKEEKTVRQPKAATKSKILVVEDDETSAEIAKLVLGNLDCEIDVAGNGEEALKLFQSKSYDMIFMDIGLPRMDGYQVTQRIRACEWNSDHHIPIIALSAHATTEHKQECIEKGMTAVLVKPLAKEKAADILNAFIPSRVKQETAIASIQPQAMSQRELLTLTGSVIDFDYASQIGFSQEMLVKRLFPMLLKSIPDDEAQMKAAYEKNEWKAVEDMAHKLKGGASYCGAVRMREACSRLEAYLMEGKTELRSKLYELALTEIEAAKKGIEEILSKNIGSKKAKPKKAA